MDGHVQTHLRSVGHAQKTSVTPNAHGFSALDVTVIQLFLFSLFYSSILAPLAATFIVALLVPPCCNTVAA